MTLTTDTPRALNGSRVSGHPYCRAVRAEVARWPGAVVTGEHRSKHFAFRVHFEGLSRMVVVPSTPSDGVCGLENCLRDVRKELRELGAVRTATRKQLRALDAAGTATMKAVRVRKRPTRSAPVLTPIPGNRADGPGRDPWATLPRVAIPAERPRISAGVGLLIFLAATVAAIAVGWGAMFFMERLP